MTAKASRLLDALRSHHQNSSQLLHPAAPWLPWSPCPRPQQNHTQGKDSPSTSKQTRFFSLPRFPLCTGKRVHQPGPVSYPSFHPPRLRLHRGTSARYPAVSRFQKGPEPGSRRTGLAPTRLDLTLFVSLQSTSTAAERFVRGRVTQSITDTASHVVDN